MTADLYPCAGGGPNDYAYIVATNREMWDGILKTIDRTDLIGDEEWANPGWRSQNWDQVREIIEPWTITRDKFDVMAAFESNGVPCSAVFDTADLLESEHLRERGMVAHIDHPQAGEYDVPGNPVRLSDSSTEVTRPPLLGEHNDEVYGELLSLDASELERLRRNEII
jgi:formyl-CoA transferase